jgi:hypothetical protein
MFGAIGAHSAFARGRCNRLIRISTDTEINVKVKPERLSVAEKDIRCTI